MPNQFGELIKDDQAQELRQLSLTASQVRWQDVQFHDNFQFQAAEKRHTLDEISVHVLGHMATQVWRKLCKHFVLVHHAPRSEVQLAEEVRDLLAKLYTRGERGVTRLSSAYRLVCTHVLRTSIGAFFFSRNSRIVAILCRYFWSETEPAIIADASVPVRKAVPTMYTTC